MSGAAGKLQRQCQAAADGPPAAAACTSARAKAAGACSTQVAALHCMLPCCAPDPCLPPTLLLTATPPAAASRVCDLTGKRANNGYVVTFSHKRNKKLQQANLQYKKVYWPEGQRCASAKPLGLRRLAAAWPAACQPLLLARPCTAACSTMLAAAWSAGGSRPWHSPASPLPPARRAPPHNPLAGGSSCASAPRPSRQLRRRGCRWAHGDGLPLPGVPCWAAAA